MRTWASFTPARQLTIAIVLFLCVAGWPASAQVPDGATRGPIYIASDLDFTPVNGVVGGLGTAESPYIIDGWTITGPPLNPLPGPGSAGPNAAVEIRDTTAHFVVSNLTIAAPSDYSLAFGFLNVEHGSLRSSHVTGFEYAISMVQVRSSSVSGNTIGVEVDGDLDDPLTHGIGVFIQDSDGVLVEENDIRGEAGGAIELYGTKNASITGNYVHDVTAGGNRGAIHLERGDAKIVDNTIERYGGEAGAWGGITAEQMGQLVVSGNVVTHTDATGRAVISVSAERLSVTDNRVTNSQGFTEMAMSVGASEHGVVAGNTLRDSGGLIVKGGLVSTHDNVVRAGGTSGFVVSRVEEWTSHNDEISGVTRPLDGSVGSGLHVDRTGRIQLTDFHSYDNDAVGASFLNGHVEANGIVIEQNQHGGLKMAGVDGATFRDCIVAENGGIAVRVTADGHGRPSKNVDVACGVDVTVDSLESTSASPLAPIGAGQESPAQLAPILILVAALVLRKRLAG